MVCVGKTSKGVRSCTGRTASKALRSIATHNAAKTLQARVSRGLLFCKQTAPAVDKLLLLFVQTLHGNVQKFRKTPLAIKFRLRLADELFVKSDFVIR